MTKHLFCGIFSLTLLPLNPYGQTGIDLPESIASPNTQVEDLHTGIGYCEGPAVDTEGNVFFTEHGGEHKIWKVTPEGEASVYRDNANLANGMEFAPDGKLVATERGRLGKEVSPGVWESITPEESAADINEANDLSFSEGGSAYFTNLGGGSVFFLDSTGTLTKYSGFRNPNGIEWIPEKGILYITIGGEGKLAQFTVNPDGSFDNRKDLANVSIPDGITTDTLGNIYTASYGAAKIFVFDSTGASLGSIDIGLRNISNCVFGGPERKTLYITGQGGIKKVELKIPGRVKYPGLISSNKNGAVFSKLITRSRALFLSKSTRRILLPGDLHPSVKQAFLLNAEGALLGKWEIGADERRQGLETTLTPSQTQPFLVFQTASTRLTLPLIGAGI